MEILKLKNITYQKDENLILDNLTFSVNKNDFIMISGPSGSGKTTFLKLIGDLISPTEGNIYYKNQDINEFEPEKYREKISYIFQTPHLFSDKVIDDLKFPFEIKEKKIEMDKVYKYLELFSLSTSILDKNPKNLSGGEKQRIALIRTILTEPEVLLLDEITASIDSENALIIENTIKKLNSQGVTILWVSHSEEQKNLGNRKLIIDKGRIDVDG